VYSTVALSNATSYKTIKALPVFYGGLVYVLTTDPAYFYSDKEVIFDSICIDLYGFFTPPTGIRQDCHCPVIALSVSAV